MNKMIGFWVVVIIIVSLVLGIALKKDFLISYNDIIYINLYMYTYDIDTYNPDKVVKVSEENKIT